MNSITEKIFYVDETKKNQRLVISAMVKNPRTWQVSKVEDMLMGDFGLMRLTFMQVSYNPSIDFVDKEAVNPDGTKDVYAMYAGYYSTAVIPDEIPEIAIATNTCVLSASTDTIKSGGSYKTINAKFLNEDGEDITDSYVLNLAIDNWHFYVDDVEIFNGELITVKEQPTNDKLKIRFSKNDDYLTKVLVVKLVTDDVEGELRLNITNL